MAEEYRIGYSWNTETGEYIADETVWIEKATGEYPCASNVTFLKPPAKEGHKARWIGQKWELVPDHRGKVIYTEKGLPRGIVDYLGELKKDDIIETPPETGEHEMLSWVNGAWEKEIESGWIKDKATGEVRQMTLAERVMDGLDKMPENCKLENGEIVPLTQEELLEQDRITLADYNEYIRQMREIEYRQNTDKIGLMVLRGEATQREWQDAIHAVKVKWPYKEA